MDRMNALPLVVYVGLPHTRALALVNRQWEECTRTAEPTLFFVESLACAYAHAPYEEKVDDNGDHGCVVAVTLRADCLWADLRQDTCFDSLVASPTLAAGLIFGDLWAVWDASAAIAKARILARDEAIRGIVREFERAGSDHRFAGVVDQYAALWWNRIDRASDTPSTREASLSDALARAAGFATRPAMLGRRLAVEGALA